MDIFNQKAFDMISLTDTVNKQPYKPQLLGRMGLFEEKSSRTVQIAIEEKTGSLSLVPTTRRGAPATQNAHNLRGIRNFSAPRIALEDRVLAEEIQGVRAFGSETELQGVQQVVSDRFGEMNDKVETTIEFHRAGAVQGIVKDSDNTTVIYNFFTEFGVSQDTTDFVLGTSGTEILDKCTAVRNNIQNELGSEGGDDIDILCLCGPVFFGKLIKHAKVTGAYTQWRAWMSGAPNYGHDPLTMDLRYKGFNFGNITFMVYRGSVGGVSFIDEATINANGVAFAFPMIGGLFSTVYAPADFMETVNTPGLPRYAKVAPDTRFNQYVDLHLQSNPLCYCKRPKVLQKLTSSN